MIIVTSIKQPEPGKGAILLLHCSYCKVSEFVFSPHACKPSRGDYYKIEMCPLGKIHPEDIGKFLFRDLYNWSPFNGYY
jgi:hypothetical protein